MKKIIKNRIFLVIICGIIFTSFGIYAANTYKASDVVYNASDGTSMNVNDALNDLYNKTGNKGYYYFYENGTSIYYNPETNEECNSSEAVSTTGTKTGCMKWYTFNDDSKSSTVNMILDHNTTIGIAWVSKEDYIVSGGTTNDYGSKGNNNMGPITVTKQLKIDIAGWDRSLNARLISAEEVAKITGNTSWTTGGNYFYFDSNSQTKTSTTKGVSKYAWLFDYTNGCTSNGCNAADSSTLGYWTSSARPGDSSNAWRVLRDGYLYRGDVSLTNSGIRPVITISKSKLS